MLVVLNQYRRVEIPISVALDKNFQTWRTQDLILQFTSNHLYYKHF